MARMRRALLGLAALAVVAVLAGCTGDDAVNQTAGTKNRVVQGAGTSEVFPVGQRTPAPTVKGELLDGGAYDMAAHRGEVVVINFWAAWCGPCRAEAADLEATYQATKADGVTFLGVNTRDGKDSATSFVTSRNSYPSLFDPPGRVVLGFKTVSPNSLPSTVVVDRQGNIAAVFRKAVLQQELEPVVRQIAAEGG